MNLKALVALCMLFGCSRREATPQAPSTERAPQVQPSASSSGFGGLDNGPPKQLALVPTVTAPAMLPLVKPGTMRAWAGSGGIWGLHLEADTITYCDRRGRRALSLAFGSEGPSEGACPALPEERNRACGGIDFIEDVREPDRDDIIDLKDGPSIPVHGFVHDCVFNNGVLLVGSGQEVVAIHMKTDRHEVKSKRPGIMVAMNEQWLAWSDTVKVFAERR